MHYLKLFIVLLVVLVTGSSRAHAQVLTYDDFKSVVPFLQKEDWESAFKKSGDLLKHSPKDDTTSYKGILTYIHIVSAAAMVANDKMTYGRLRKSILKYKGHMVLMAAHPVAADGSNTINKTFLSNNDTTGTGFTTSTNRGGTIIFCFERFTFKNKINPADFDNAVVRCGGRLAAIEINPHETKTWIVRLRVSDAFIHKAN